MRPLTKISIFGFRLATCVLAVYWLLLFTGTHVPQLPEISPRISDKMLHLSAFFGLATLLCWVVPTREHIWRKFIIVTAVTLTYAAFDEITQSFVRGRTTDIKDFAADTLGVLSAITLYAVVRRLIPRWSKPLPLDQGDEDASAVVASDSYRHQAPRPRAMSADHDSINVA